VPLAGYSTLYTVGPEEFEVVLWFGKYHHTTAPGLNYKVPFIQRVKYTVWLKSNPADCIQLNIF